MKKVFAILICAVMLITLCGCKPGGTQSSQAPSGGESKEVGNGAEPGVLRVVTDIDCLSSSPRIRGDSFENSQAKNGQRTFKLMLKHCGGTPNGLDVELEVLPRESVEYEAELTHLRTEIMAGGGPDVFLMSGFGGGDRLLPEDTLFQNPEAAMKRGLFLPLDEYIENAQFMELEKLHSKVMDAGCCEGKRYILPMFYRISFGWAHKVIDPSELPESWDEAVASSDSDIRALYGKNLATASFRQSVFGQTADNYKEELILDKDEFFRRTKEALELYRESFLADGYTYDQRGCCSWGNYLVGRFSGSAPGENTFFSPRNCYGGLSAAIENYCAVNANTKYPEDAFFIADMLLGADFLKLENFWDKQPARTGADAVDMFWMMEGGNIPVYTDYMTTKTSYANTVIYKDMQEALAGEESRISFAYFTTNADRAMDGMFRDLMETVESGKEISDEELRGVTDKAYTTMKMMLAES